jgi:hypothetical protein
MIVVEMYLSNIFKKNIKMCLISGSYQGKQSAQDNIKKIKLH